MTESILLIIIFIMAILLYRQNHLNKNNNKLVKSNSALKSKVTRVNNDLHKTQEMANIGSWVLDLKNQDLRWSLQTYEIFGLDSKVNYDSLYDEFLNKIHPEDVNNVKETYKKSLKDKKSYILEYRLAINDTSIKYVIEHSETTFDEEGTALISYGTVQDITEATIGKMEIREKDLHLLHQSRLAQMGEMLSMIAHQWKQPLGTISASTIAVIMAIELQQYNLDDKKSRDEFLKFTLLKLNNISSYVQNLSQIITDFSDFYKPNKNSEIVNLDELILKTNSLFGETISRTGIVVEFDLDAECEVYIHENEFMQVILNLLNNAKEQLVSNKIDNAKINIKTYIIEDNVFVEISDNGGGISKENINDIFNPYFSTKLEKNGTGLGLYMSKIIIKDYHDGDISVKNIEDGARFIIRISKW